jgi:hypothetical protein
MTHYNAYIKYTEGACIHKIYRRRMHIYNIRIMLYIYNIRIMLYIIMLYMCMRLLYIIYVHAPSVC